MNQILLHDIFPPLEVNDNSLLVFIVLVVVSVTLIFLSMSWILKKYSFNRDKTLKKHLSILKNCDLSQARVSAFCISYYGRLLAQSREEKALIEELIRELEIYKYKKNMPEISSELKERVLMFIDTIESKYA